MFVAFGIWCLADVSSVSPSSEQTVYLSVRLSVCLFLCLSICLSVYLSVCLSACRFFCIYASVKAHLTVTSQCVCCLTTIRRFVNSRTELLFTCRSFLSSGMPAYLLFVLFASRPNRCLLSVSQPQSFKFIPWSFSLPCSSICLFVFYPMN